MSQTTTAALRHLFACYGLPEQIVSDNNPQFAAQDVATCLKGTELSTFIAHLITLLQMEQRKHSSKLLNNPCAQVGMMGWLPSIVWRTFSLHIVSQVMLWLMFLLVNYSWGDVSVQGLTFGMEGMWETGSAEASSWPAWMCKRVYCVSTGDDQEFPLGSILDSWSNRAEVGTSDVAGKHYWRTEMQKSHWSPQRFSSWKWWTNSSSHQWAKWIWLLMVANIQWNLWTHGSSPNFLFAWKHLSHRICISHSYWWDTACYITSHP